MTGERGDNQTNNVLSGVLILFYASLALLGSFVLWAFSENIYLWAWHYRLTHFWTYTPYTNFFKTASMAVGFVGLAGVAFSLVLLLDGLVSLLRSK